MARPRVVAPTSSDAQAVLAHLQAWDAGVDGRGARRTTDLFDVARMLAATGDRTGELFPLEWRHLNLAADPPAVSIERTVALGLDGRLAIQEWPKLDTSRRVLKLPPFAAEMLLERRLNSHSEFVFPSSTGTLRSPNNFRTQWRGAFRERSGQMSRLAHSAKPWRQSFGISSAWAPPAISSVVLRNR